MIKNLLTLLLISTLTFVKAQTGARDLLSLPNPIELDGTEFYISWSKQASKTLYRQQYLPADETIEEFNQILEFSYFTKEIEMDLAVRQKVEEIQNREESDKYAKVNVVESPDGKEYIVDYFISQKPENGTEFIEYNVYRFKSIDVGTAKHFLIFSYAKRAYGNLKSSFKSLNKQRDHILTTLISFPVPTIKAVSTN